MQVSRVAYDRFEMQLPAPEPGWEPLTEGCVAREVASWLWQFGPTPLIAVVERDGKKAPGWVSSRLSVEVPWNGGVANAVILEQEPELEQFLMEGAPHQRTHFMWPRRSPAKTFEAMCNGAWKDEVEGEATVSPVGCVQVLQLQPCG
jgi:hypothetical protein